MKKGDVFTLTFTVSDQVYQNFIELFRDRNPLHVDDDYAARKGFRERVMHGNILNGFISYFVGEGLPEKNVALVSQDITYVKPVYRGDELVFRAEVDDVHESVGIVEFKYSFVNSENVRVAKGTIRVKVLS